MATIVPPVGEVPTKYIVTLTPGGGTPVVFDVRADFEGYGYVNLHTLTPCTTYTLAAVAVLPDGSQIPAANTVTFTTPDADGKICAPIIQEVEVEGPNDAATTITPPINGVPIKYNPAKKKK